MAYALHKKCDESNKLMADKTREREKKHLKSLSFFLDRMDFN